MAMLWLMLVGLSVVCQGHPGIQIQDLDDELYTEVRDLLNKHATHRAPANALSRPKEVVGWPRPLPHLGQVTGVAVNSRGQPVIFHRGPRVWDTSCFNASHHFQHVAEGPIAVSTVLTLEPETGAVIGDWGRNLFYMPHGITLNAEDNVWLTDVALHQVFKFRPGETFPALTLGEPFSPGDGPTRLCQPTAVAVASSGQAFVADGNCNHRVLMLSPRGRLIRLIPLPSEFLSLQVPHGLALIEALDLLCIADRENMRVACPRAGLVPYMSAQPVSIQAADLGRVFGVVAVGGLVYAVNGPTSLQIPVRGFTLDPRSETAIDRWGPSAGFRSPHGIAISPNGTAMYVTEIGPNKVWKFSLAGGGVQ
ncbi:peptidyl-alpha-hydroxyglycine alpha-amidating lyase 2-like [Zootermopsis nevadensis]|uniref:peptidylamidoglycolate lyase n=1 Tax=Zootermopsis nevadensis TaxID=136037 RepID=A0A067QWN9_ZOONE|nr:peptidyl-alpha-hydroxyglycine alpha-amidating lyase 2-like [Zootermopsis nevadensis]KDR10480.1 Peptidyl-alpha-hydroxyglycine alpha-amidating lyase 2 [Zootermopsis nevadensis]